MGLLKVFPKENSPPPGFSEYPCGKKSHLLTFRRDQRSAEFEGMSGEKETLKGFYFIAHDCIPVSLFRLVFLNFSCFLQPGSFRSLRLLPHQSSQYRCHWHEAQYQSGLG